MLTPKYLDFLIFTIPFEHGRIDDEHTAEDLAKEVPEVVEVKTAADGTRIVTRMTKEYGAPTPAYTEERLLAFFRKGKSDVRQG